MDLTWNWFSRPSMEFAVVLAILAVLSQFVQSDDRAINFSIHLVAVTDTSACFTWTGLPQTNVINYCEFYQKENGSLQVDSRPRFLPNSGNKSVNHLMPSTQYSIHMFCSANTTQYRSSIVTFSTAARGHSYTILATTPSSLDDEDSEVTKKKILYKGSSVTDIAIGVFFGLVGLGVIVTMLYYVAMRFRRHQRIQRFLQYRQQENDPFPDFTDQDQDEND